MVATKAMSKVVIPNADTSRWTSKLGAPSAFGLRTSGPE
jgi:hypothetical protein